MRKSDIETGGSALYPTMLENPEYRWAFIRKVYAIIFVQLLITAAVAFFVVHFHQIPKFVLHTWPGITVYVLSFLLSLAFMFLLFACHEYHPWNFLILGLFTVSFAFMVGLSCSFANGKIILEAVILTGVAVVGLTIYTFWAVRRGHDFSFLGPFLFSSLAMLIAFGLILAFFRMGKVSLMIYGFLGAFIFCGYIVYDTNELIKNYTYDQYVLAAISLYLDIVNLFVNILSLLINSDADS
ncbi:hypothetical protein SLE2022_169950 [Rubroshorea leprosula]